MDFIETIFGVSPDGGNGMLEVLYLIAAVTFVALIVTRHRIGRIFRSGRHNDDDGPAAR